MPLNLEYSLLKVLQENKDIFTIHISIFNITKCESILFLFIDISGKHNLIRIIGK